jgi:lipoic acid synthetase
MILGNICTRNCKFCAVTKSNGEKLSIDANEPYRISEAVKSLSLSYCVITSVTRDDLLDGGASQFVKTVELIRSVNQRIKIEVLIPDFQGKVSSLQRILEAGPRVLAHNIEMAERLYNEVRPMSDYRLSLKLLSKVKELKPEIVTKSSVMLGLGETEQEVVNTFRDLRNNHCDIVTLGQYLAPSQNHYPVQEFISVEQFRRYQAVAVDMGFKAVLSGPLVRSSYRAEEVFETINN